METTTTTQRTSFFTQEIHSDVTVHVCQIGFPLHKFILVSKSNYMRKLVLESDSADLSRIDLSGIPGGAEAFERAAKFCYGVNFEITVHNVAALLCAAEYLEMTDEYCANNLATRTADFLSQVALQSLTGAVVVLKSCEELLPVAEDLSIVGKCIEIASAKACIEENFPSHSPPNWWMDELSILNVTFYKRVINAIKARGAKVTTLASAIIVYTETSLGELMLNDWRNGMKSLDTEESDIMAQQREILESIVTLLPSEKSLFPINFLCRLLRSAIFLRIENGCKFEIEKRITAVLERVTVDDLLMLSLTNNGEKLYDLESVKRIISGFTGTEKSVAVFSAGDLREVFSTTMQRVTKVVDAYLGEIATCGELSIAKFNGIANLIPRGARANEDDLYRAIDIYLMAHPDQDELEREKICTVMNPHKLTSEARAHASKNKRLPLQVVLHALYYDQLKLRSGVEDNRIVQPDAISMRNQVKVEVSLAKENEALRMELQKMKMYIQDINKLNQATSPRAHERETRPSFLSSMSKTFERWNPFHNNDESKDTLSIRHGIINVDLTKPRKRRFSIS